MALCVIETEAETFHAVEFEGEPDDRIVVWLVEYADGWVVVFLLFFAHQRAVAHLPVAFGSRPGLVQRGLCEALIGADFSRSCEAGFEFGRLPGEAGAAGQTEGERGDKGNEDVFHGMDQFAGGSWFADRLMRDACVTGADA